MQSSKPRKFKGFAAINRQGHLLWGTIRTTEDEAKSLHDRFNPDPTGQGMGEKIVSITIYI